MTSPENVSPSEPVSPLTSDLPLALPKIRRLSSNRGLAHYPISNLPARVDDQPSPVPSGPKQSLEVSRPASPPRYSPNGLRSDSKERSSSTGQAPSSSLISETRHDEPRDLIVRSFVPHIAVYASADTDHLLRLKDFDDGLLGLLKCYAERILGKVVVRDSAGASRTWDNFGVRFINIIEDASDPKSPGLVRSGGTVNTLQMGRQTMAPFADRDLSASPYSINGRTNRLLSDVDELVKHAVSRSNPQRGDFQASIFDAPHVTRQLPPTTTSPFFPLYLRKLLSGLPMVPYETFSHPVACIIAISSQNPNPIEALRQLYSSTSQGHGRVPGWVSNEYLRYYVLVHDEDRDDIAKSTSLYDQMKRHFGLHCHLLRLRSSQCLPTDDESTPVPACQWLSARDEILELRKMDPAENDEDGPSSRRFIFESDAVAVRTFLREMVTQSVVPFMESRIALWNDQVASRRRGLSGRFMSLSKKWTGFGSGKAPASGPGGSISGSGTNYDTYQGYYPPDTPEATMRKLADYAFMLRDWKLAQSTYDILRTDFANDKAWRYHAGANEMAAISTLLLPQMASSRTRTESIDQMLDTASYSYLSRCSNPYGAVRCLTLAVELLRGRGAATTEEAARWAMRLLELAIATPMAQALTMERIAECYKSRLGAGTRELGLRRRKAAFWCVLASEAWLKLQQQSQARLCLEDAKSMYNKLDQDTGSLPFTEMQQFWDKLHNTLFPKSSSHEDVNPQVLVDYGDDPLATGDSELITVDTEAKIFGAPYERKSDFAATDSTS